MLPPAKNRDHKEVENVMENSPKVILLLEARTGWAEQ
jgi:hypothetical protein